MMCKLSLCGAFTLLSFVYAIRGSCDMEELQRCYAASPALLNSTNIYYAVTREEMDKNCFELRIFTNCLGTYMRRCMDKHEEVVIQRTYAGITEAILSLCTPGSYQDEYLRHAICVKSIRPEYEECSKKHEVTLASINERQKTEPSSEDSNSLDENLRTVCCSFQEYLVCSEQTVQMSCGDEAEALFTKSFLKKMSSNMIQSFCDQYDEEACGLGEGSLSNFSSFVIGFVMLANLFGAAQKIVVFSGFTFVKSIEDYIFEYLEYS